MAGATYPLEPIDVPQVETKNRKIVTKLPAPESIAVLEKLRETEPLSMSGQPPIVWDRAEGFHVYDRWGNKWLDFTSGVLVASAGHSRPEIAKALKDQVDSGLLHNYCFPSEIRSRLAAKLIECSPAELQKVFLLTTGAEATECCIKLAKTWGQKVGGADKNVFVSFEGAFHGRTLGAQLAGGIPGLKTWINPVDESFVQAPFPGSFRVEDQSFDGFLKVLAEKGVKPGQICGVMTETYQGGDAWFAPVDFVRDLRKWCDDNDVVLIFDEVQAGFGRTGTLFGYEHYGVEADLIARGKGISSSLPLSAVMGRQEILDQYGPGSMTSTHTGSPLCCAAALASLDIVLAENLSANAAEMEKPLQAGLAEIKAKYPDNIANVGGKGLVAALNMVKPGSLDPDPDAAFNIVWKCVQKGLLFFSPVGTQGSAVKISPPLIIDEEAITEGVGVIAEACDEVLG